MKNNTILIIDDDKNILKMLIRRLKKTGIEIHTAVNGKIEKKLAIELQPDIVLADIRMPVMSGLEMIKSLRQEGYQKLVVACTASVRLKDEKNTIDAGFDYFIPKPIGDDFEEIIETLLNKQ